VQKAGNMTVNQNDVIRLYAVWEANTYTVTLYRNSSAEDTAAVVQNYVVRE